MEFLCFFCSFLCVGKLIRYVIFSNFDGFLLFLMFKSVYFVY